MSKRPSRIYVPDLTIEEQDSLDELIWQWRAKRHRNALRTGFYDMTNAADHVLGSKVPQAIRRQRFVLGWSRIAVDKLARRCNLEGFYDAAGNNLDELGMPELLRSNRATQGFNEVGVSSLIHAVAFIVTIPGELGEPDALMLGRSALNSTGVWDERRRALSAFLSINAMTDGGEPSSMTLYLPDLVVTIERASDISQASPWRVERQEHRWGVPVDPIRYRPRLERPFGSSRITRAVMSYHVQATAAMFGAAVNGAAYSMPRYVALGVTEEAFRNADGSPKPTWQAAWDAVWAIEDDPDAPSDGLARADVKQFTGQSPEPQNAHLRMLAQMFSGETGIPIGELGLIGDANPTSYESLLASREDLIAEAESTTDDWSPDLSAAATRALAIANKGDLPPELDIQPRWRSHMFTSRAAAADAGTKVIASVPWLAETQVGLEQLGLSEEQITRALADRRRQRGSEVLDALRNAAAQTSQRLSNGSDGPDGQPPSQDAGGAQIDAQTP